MNLVLQENIVVKANWCLAFISMGVIYKNSSNGFIRKEFLNTDVKNTLECFKGAFEFSKRKKISQQRSKSC